MNILFPITLALLCSSKFFILAPFCVKLSGGMVKKPGPKSNETMKKKYND